MFVMVFIIWFFVFKVCFDLFRKWKFSVCSIFNFVLLVVFLLILIIKFLYFLFNVFFINFFVLKVVVSIGFFCLIGMRGSLLMVVIFIIVVLLLLDRL